MRVSNLGIAQESRLASKESSPNETSDSVEILVGEHLRNSDLMVIMGREGKDQKKRHIEVLRNCPKPHRSVVGSSALSSYAPASAGFVSNLQSQQELHNRVR